MAALKISQKMAEGQRYGRLMVISQAASAISSSGKTRRRWLCRCDCGNEAIVRQGDLRSGNTQSCGCLYRLTRPFWFLTHGESKTQIYKAWSTMKERCYNPHNEKYPDYGGRGITVCDRWRKSFLAFIADMGPRPPGKSIDRIDNNGNYEPGNCRWATRAVQAANRRNNVIVEWRGEKMILRDAINLAGLPRKAVEHRLRRGWPLDQALKTPLRIR